MEIDRIEAMKNIFAPNRYGLDLRFVINDGNKHPYFILIPGGGFSMVCSFIEGVPVARELNRKGYSVFILRYRVKKKAVYPAPQDDLARAVREIAEDAEKYNITGGYNLMGFSAGGYLAASFGTKTMGYARYGLPAPEKIYLGYPVITMGELTHKGTCENHLSVINETNAREHSVELHIDRDYPETVIVTGTADRTVNTENTRLMENALNAAGVKNRVLWIENADHGFGQGNGTPAENWIDKIF